MRWIPLYPRWLVVPIIAAVLAAALIVSNGGSVWLFYAIGIATTCCATFGMDAWYERRHRR